METNTSFSITDRLKSFVHAFNGIKSFFKTEHNAWVHLLAAVTVIVIGAILDINNVEWCLIILAIGIVFVTEILNTSIEKLTDIVSPNYNEKAKIVKDLAAAAVLVASCIAVVIGLLVFLPYLNELI